MVASSRPEWTRSTTGIPIDCVVRIHGGTPGTRQDILTSRNRVSLIRPGSLQPKPEDEYEFSFVYGSEATNSDIHDRTVTPLLRKFIEGYNVTIIMFGATGSGKTTTLEGGRGKDTRGTSDGDGLVHLAIDELFELVHGKAVSVGEAIAKKRRMPSAKGFDFFVESSFVEVYNEACHDLYAKGADIGSNLQVVEDVGEGYVVAGLGTSAAKNATELRAGFNYGRSNRDTQMMDLGSVHERTAAIFTVWLAQYAPAAVHGDEDRIIVSRLSFVDLPGAERLGMDPEVLRLREGLQLNKSLLAMSVALRKIAQEGSTQFVNYEDSVLTRLLSDTLGGNALTAFIGTIRQGDWEQSSTSLKHLTVARNARNYPIINHSRARGLLHKLRFRLMSVMEDRETLRDQLSAAPAEGDPNDMAINVAKIRDMEARLLEEREEKAALMAEKQALQARLAKLKDAGTGELREKAELQEALVRAEEQRLEVSRALIDFQMDFNECKQEFENQKFTLEQRMLELESSKLEHYVRQEDHAALNDITDRLNSQLKEAREDSERARKAQLAAEDAAGEALKEVRRLNQLMAALEAAGQGDATALMEGADGADMPAAPTAGQKLNMLELRQQLQTQLKYKERRIQELESQLADVMAREERTRQLRTVNQESLDQARNIFKRKMEAAARELSDVTRVAALAASDASSTLRMSPEEVGQRLLRFIDQALQVSDERQAELKRDAEELAARHAELKRRFRMLYGGYRALRYRIEDEWPVAAGNPMRVAHEDTVVAGSMEDLLRADEDTDRKAAAALRERLARMEAEMGQLKVQQLEWETGLGHAHYTSSSSDARDARGGTSSSQHTSHGHRAADANAAAAANSVLLIENARLRDEMDHLKRSVGGMRLSSMDGSLAPDATKAQMAAELAELRAENERLRVASTSAAMSGEAVPAGAKGSDGLRKQLKEFTLNTQMDLERKVQGAESRAVMAEEQLAQLQKYIAQASITYQREIMRLRAIVSKLDPTGAALRAAGPATAIAPVGGALGLK